MRHILPDPYPTGACVLVPMDIGLLPIIIGQLSPLLEKRLWVADSYQAGYYAIVEVLYQMTTCTMDSLIQEIRDFRGIKPEFAETPIEERTSDMYNSLNDSYAKLLELRGIMDDGWFTDTYTTLKDVVQAQRGTNQAITEENWGSIADLLAPGASIIDIAAEIGSMLTNVGETAVEGGLLSTLVAITAANAAMMAANAVDTGLVIANLNSIITALRGADAPTDNILQSIRGDTPADATRNIVEQLV